MEAEQIRLLREKLRQLEISTNSQFRNGEGCCGMTFGQCHTFLEIGKNKEISLVDLTSILGLDASTLSRTISGLVMLGLVSRMISPNDRRYISISLTEQGRKVYNDIDELFAIYFLNVFKLIPGEKHKQVLESIVLFSDAVRKYQAAAGRGAERDAVQSA